MKLKAIVRDVDGTLCDTLPPCLTAIREVFARHVGRILGDGEIMARFGATEVGTIRGLVADDWRAAHDGYLEHRAARHAGSPTAHRMGDDAHRPPARLSRPHEMIEWPDGPT